MTFIGLLILCYLVYMLYKSRHELLHLFFRRQPQRRQGDSAHMRNEQKARRQSNDFIDRSEAEYVDFEDVTEDKQQS